MTRLKAQSTFISVRYAELGLVAGLDHRPARLTPQGLTSGYKASTVLRCHSDTTSDCGLPGSCNAPTPCKMQLSTCIATSPTSLGCSSCTVKVPIQAAYVTLSLTQALSSLPVQPTAIPGSSSQQLLEPPGLQLSLSAGSDAGHTCASGQSLQCPDHLHAQDDEEHGSRLRKGHAGLDVPHSPSTAFGG